MRVVGCVAVQNGRTGQYIEARRFTVLSFLFGIAALLIDEYHRPASVGELLSGHRLLELNLSEGRTFGYIAGLSK